MTEERARACQLKCHYSTGYWPRRDDVSGCDALTKPNDDGRDEEGRSSGWG